MASVNLGSFNVGSTDRIRLTITKDGAAWTGIDSVTLTFENPDRSTQFSRSATLDATNVWYYDTTTTDFEDVGWWTMRVRVIDGAISKAYPHEIGFYVGDEP